MPNNFLLPAKFLKSDREILTSRMIDRRGRPLAAKGFVKEVGISWNLLVVRV
jgi:polyribonucleotide nucleotidyltransferase